jgi:hypothetical protein
VDNCTIFKLCLSVRSEVRFCKPLGDCETWMKLPPKTTLQAARLLVTCSALMLAAAAFMLMAAGHKTSSNNVLPVMRVELHG